MKKAMIAMSGGVDSSVAAWLMKRDGYDCMGVTMRLFAGEDSCERKGHTCCSLDDVEDARSVARQLGIPYFVFNFTEDFGTQIMDRFVCAYENGFTPNPCIDCNRYMKFEKLMKRAKELDYDYVVTGHYARIEEQVMDKFVHCYECGITPNPCIDCNRYLKFEYLYKRAQELGMDYVVTGHYAQIAQDEKTGRYLLKKAVDPGKDQSYVLYSLTQEQLAHTQFPLGGMPKSETRAIAEAHGFVNAKKHDSQDICFVPDGNYAKFIEQHACKTYPEGDFVDVHGNVLGRHKGIIRYTIGQRKGLGLALKEPMYVMDVDIEKNQVVLGRNEDLFSKRLVANDVNLISISHIDAPIRVTAKVRYRHTEAPATVNPLSDGKIEVIFDEPQRAITKGQAVVLYDGDIVVGGGTICETEKLY